mmetsp:Transcript_5037/g.10924  ORF Transcript_5037/g.10924 Transcript_5037/m.10924 type:complete len:285 (-) Transcript_5037:940-1794(-)
MSLNSVMEYMRQTWEPQCTLTNPSPSPRLSPPLGNFPPVGHERSSPVSSDAEEKDGFQRPNSPQLVTLNDLILRSPLDALPDKDEKKRTEEEEEEEEGRNQRRGKRRKRTNNSGLWTNEQIQLLCQTKERFKDAPWAKIAEYVPGKTGAQCNFRWNKIEKKRIEKENGTRKRGTWTEEARTLLYDLVTLKLDPSTKKVPKRKQGFWVDIAVEMSDRLHLLFTEKQCLDRWVEYEDPSLDNRKLTKEQEELMKTGILEGKNWQSIKQESFPEKPNNYIKNTFYCV